MGVDRQPDACAAGIVDEEWDDSTLFSLLLHPLPVLRTVPLGVREAWLQGLAKEPDHLHRSLSVTAVHRLHLDVAENGIVARLSQ